MKNLRGAQRPFTGRGSLVISSIALSLVWLTAATGRADWPATGDDKVVQGVFVARPCALTEAPTPLVADNFTCTMPGEILGIHIWGGWRDDWGEDIRTPTAQFAIALYEDAVPGATTPTEPAPSAVWSDTFDPANYKIMKRSGPQTEFFDPNNPADIRSKSDVYLYNFYPKPANVFRQTGTQAKPKLYWLSVGVSGGTTGKGFGWQGADALGDGAKFRNAAGLWEPLVDPNGKVVDRAFAVTTAMLAGFSKTCENRTGMSVNELIIELDGKYEVYQTYNGWPGLEWPHFETTDSAAGNTLLRWTGRTIQAGEKTRIGFLVPVKSSSDLKLKGIAWVRDLGGGVSMRVGCPTQYIPQYDRQLSNVELINTLVCSPPTLKYAGNITLEYYDHPVPLELLDESVTSRHPLQTDVLPIGPMAIPGGDRVAVRVPTAPANATYAVLIVKLNDTALLTDQAGATTDFSLLPLDQLGTSPSLLYIRRGASNVVLYWPAACGDFVLYQSDELGRATWTPVGSPAQNVGGAMSVTVPVEGFSRFFRLQEAPSLLVTDRVGDLLLYHPDFQENHGIEFSNNAAVPPELDILSVETERDAEHARFRIRTAGQGLLGLMADRTRHVQFGVLLPDCSGTNGLIAATDRQGEQVLIFSPQFQLLGATPLPPAEAGSITLSIPLRFVPASCAWAAFSAYSPEAQAYYPTPLQDLVALPIVDTAQAIDSQVLNIQTVQTGTGQQCQVTGMGTYFCPPAPSTPGLQTLPGPTGPYGPMTGWKFTETRCLDRAVSLWCTGAFWRWVERGTNSGWIAKCPFVGGQNFCVERDLDGDGCPDRVVHVVYDGGGDDDGDNCRDLMVYDYSFGLNLVTILNRECDSAGNLRVNDPDPASPHAPFDYPGSVPGPHPGPPTHPPGGCP